MNCISTKSPDNPVKNTSARVFPVPCRTIYAKSRPNIGAFMKLGIALMILTGSGLALAAPPPEAPPPKLIDLYRANSDPALAVLPSGFSYAVASLAFSPDEQWIAVELRPRAIQAGVTPSPNGTLLLLPLHPADGRRVEIDAGTGGSVLWSPDSESVVVHANLPRGHGAPRIYNLRGQLVWTGPQSGPLLGFIAPGRLLARHAKANGRPAGFDIVDIRTSAVTPWFAPRHGRFAAIDSERGLLAVFPDSEGSKTLIVDYATGKIVQSVKNQNQTTTTGSPCYSDEVTICDLNTFAAPQVFFAENGKSLCEAARVGAFKNHPVCRDVDTGKTIAEFQEVDGGSPAGASTRATRMVLSKLNGYSGRVVWDFRSGTEVAAWEPSTRQNPWLGPVSPLGNYIAEALGDELHIYQIP
jgi:hypothetical protein